jgi:hypothetical protein
MFILPIQKYRPAILKDLWFPQNFVFRTSKYKCIYFVPRLATFTLFILIICYQSIKVVSSNPILSLRSRQYGQTIDFSVGPKEINNFHL